MFIFCPLGGIFLPFISPASCIVSFDNSSRFFYTIPLNSRNFFFNSISNQLLIPGSSPLISFNHNSILAIAGSTALCMFVWISILNNRWGHGGVTGPTQGYTGKWRWEVNRNRQTVSIPFALVTSFMRPGKNWKIRLPWNSALVCLDTGGEGSANRGYSKPLAAWSSFDDRKVCSPNKRNPVSGCIPDRVKWCFFSWRPPKGPRRWSDNYNNSCK